MSALTSDVIGVEIDLHIIGGRNLVAKDGSGFLKLGSKTTSDPYVIATLGEHRFETNVVMKNLNPEWDAKCKWSIEGRQFKPSAEMVLTIFDRDRGSADDPMGAVRLTLRELMTAGQTDKWYPVKDCPGCKNATGELHLGISIMARKAMSLSAKQSLPIPPTATAVAVGVGWDMLPGGRAIDLDTSCVCVAFNGQLLMDECVYFANLRSASGAILHTGDEREGDEDLGQGDDEVITVDLRRVPSSVCAIFFIGTVADEGKTFSDVKTARMRLVDWATGAELCRYTPAMEGKHTAMFVGRLGRAAPQAPWHLQAMGEMDHTARDWGTLVPEVKMFSKDLVPNIKVDVNERVAIMRKGGVIRLSDFAPGGVPAKLVMGLAWDVTNGVNIDLDASAILLDAKLSPIDLVFFGKLRSSDGSIQHGGDEREGDEKGDDEKIFLALDRVHPAVTYIGFVINSYSGHELDDVKASSCHLFDGATYRDLATFKMSNCKFLDKRTALLVGMLFRDAATGSWGFEVISEAADGRKADENIDELQRFIQRKPNRELGPPRPPPGAGEGMISRTAGAMAGLMRSMSGRLLGAPEQPPAQPPVALV